MRKVKRSSSSATIQAQANFPPRTTLTFTKLQFLRLESHRKVPLITLTFILTLALLQGQTQCADAATTTASPLTSSWPTSRCENVTSVSAIRVAADGVTEVNVGVIIISGHGAPYDVERTGAAIQMGFDYVNSHVLNASYRIVKIEEHYGPLCDAARAPGIAAYMYYKMGLAALIGPGCTHALSPVGRLAGYWNIPIVTGLGDAGAFKNKTDFPTLTRMAYCQCRLRKVFGSVFTTFNYTDITLIRSRDDLHASVLGETLDAGLKKQGILPKILNYYKTDNIREVLQNAADYSRGVIGLRFVSYSHDALDDSIKVIILCVDGDHVRDFMLMAHQMGFTNGEYVFMDVELFKFKGDYWGEHDWQRNDGDDLIAKEAYNSLLRIALYEPNGTHFAAFANEVKLKAKEMYNFTYGNEKVNFFVGAFYDSVISYGQALNETLQLGLDPLDGYKVARRMWNKTFTGITEEVLIDDNGDRDTSYSIMDMDPITGDFEPVAHYWGSKPGYNPVKGRTIYWGGGRYTPPPNTPFCGFRKENPACEEDEPMSPVMIGIVSVLSIIIVGGLAGFLAYRKYQLESELRDMSWLVDSEDVKHRKTTYMSSMVAMSVVSAHSGGTSMGSQKSVKGTHGQVYTDMALYKGQSVAMRQLKKKQIVINRKLLLEVKSRRHLHSDNIVKFVGAVIEPPKILIMHEYCPKGSLQDLLANESINLDNVFKMSLIEDIVKGMIYIHGHSETGFHGRLRSSNCVVDNRFILKLTDFGLPTFYAEEDQGNADNEFHHYSRLLWTAPELLRAESPVHGTPKGDVFAFGIILEEIIMRGGPYDTARAFMEPKEIVEKVKEGGKDPFRPMVPKDQCSPQLRDLMSHCVTEDPGGRPDFNYIKKICRLVSGGRETNLLDNLLKRMEQYANNLEGIVAERTALLVQEQKKTEQLLLQILPRSIMEQLKAGKTVDPEWFDEVSIYFSDIVGFTTISAASTPIQVVTMLNDLYTAFDSTIEQFDVYKVETIGDAYMVASGLPMRNGNLHAREIARMSMALLASISKFRMQHMPDMILRLRIGLHSGPVCAGVVGLKMPRYCLFGDTVNTASRMESNGMALKIHISQTTRDILETFDIFRLEERGSMEIKGKGNMTTYWLLGEK